VTHHKLIVRDGAEHDLEKVNDIYNQYVKDTHFTFDLEPMTIEARREWFSHYGTAGRHRLLVGVSDEAVVGFACSSRFRPKPGYETSVETTIYLVPDAVGRRARLGALQGTLPGAGGSGHPSRLRGDRPAQPCLSRPARALRL
jgi:phosphinothricin acetyltransferase